MSPLKKLEDEIQRRVGEINGGSKMAI